MDIYTITWFVNPKVGQPPVGVEVIDTTREFKWRLLLEGKKLREESPWFTNYSSINCHEFSNGQRWYVATAYWEGTFKEMTPFLATYSTEA